MISKKTGKISTITDAERERLQGEPHATFFTFEKIKEAKEPKAEKPAKETQEVDAPPSISDQNTEPGL